MADKNGDLNLFELGQNCFDDLIKEFAIYDIDTRPGIELRKGTGLLCYYNREDQNIYLSVPDLGEPAGKLQALFLRSLLRCESHAELMRFFQLLMPQVIAHELAHHLRDLYQRFDTANMWYEEQVANLLAVAVVKHRLSPQQKDEAKAFLQRAIEGLAEHLEAKNIAVDSYYSVLHALDVGGQIEDSEFENIESLQNIFAIDTELMLKSSGQLSPELTQRLEHRRDLIDNINEQYAADQIQYIYYQVGWLYLALTSRETQYVEEFARTHLGLTVELLPLIEIHQNPTENEIQACFKASQEVLPYSEAASRYFYKRYRSLLLAKLQFVELQIPGLTEKLKKEATLLLENWNEKQLDTLSYLAQLAPVSLRNLFPHLIADHIESQLEVQHHLPTETDRRLWNHIMLQAEDEGAANTLHRLTLLERAGMYRPLSAELLLEMLHNFCRVKFAPGEAVIWEHERNDDVFILIDGKLEVVVMQEGQFKRVGMITPGQVFGEIAFFTEDPRYATVRAIEPSECFVLKDSDLEVFAFKYPSILMQMAGVLAKRLADMYQISNNETV